jgi:hypothetical protein
MLYTSICLSYAFRFDDCVSRPFWLARPVTPTAIPLLTVTVTVFGCLPPATPADGRTV